MSGRNLNPEALFTADYWGSYDQPVPSTSRNSSAMLGVVGFGAYRDRLAHAGMDLMYGRLMPQRLAPGTVLMNDTGTDNNGYTNPGTVILYDKESLLSGAADCGFEDEPTDDHEREALLKMSDPSRLLLLGVDRQGIPGYQSFTTLSPTGIRMVRPDLGKTYTRTVNLGIVAHKLSGEPTVMDMIVLTERHDGTPTASISGALGPKLPVTVDSTVAHIAGVQEEDFQLVRYRRIDIVKPGVPVKTESKTSSVFSRLMPRILFD